MVNNNLEKTETILKTTLKIFGLEPIFTINNYFDFTDPKYILSKNIINYSYSFFIFFLLWFRPISETILAFTQKNETFAPSIIFDYLAPIQYYLGFIYFKSQRKKRIYESLDHSFIKNKTGLRYLPNESFLIKSVLLISGILILEEELSFHIIDELSIYKFDSQITKNLFKFFITLSIIPERFILSLNSHVFLFSFLQQVDKLKDLKDKLKNTTLVRKTSVATLCYEINDVRYTLSRLIDKTNYMFISTTAIGGIAFGVLLGLDLYNYTNCSFPVLFVLMQIVFLAVISRIGFERNNISKITQGRRFASIFILRKNKFCKSCLDNEKKNIGLTDQKMVMKHNKIFGESYVFSKRTLRSYNDDTLETFNVESKRNICMKDKSSSCVNENTTSHESLNNNHLTYSQVMNFDQHYRDEKKNKERSDLNKKPEFTFPKTTIYDDNDNYNNLRENENLDSEENGVSDKGKKMRKNISNLLKMTDSSNPDENKKNIYSHIEYEIEHACQMKEIDYLKCIYEWSTNTGSSVDWLILQILLNENWESFSFLGIEFSDGKAFSTAMFVTISVVVSGSFLSASEFFSEF